MLVDGSILPENSIVVSLIRAMLFEFIPYFPSTMYYNTTTNHDRFSYMYMYICHDLERCYQHCASIRKSGIGVVMPVFALLLLPVCGCLYPSTIFLLNLVQNRSFQIFYQTNTRITCAKGGKVRVIPFKCALLYN